MSNRDAAERLGWPIGSISHRLARGREILRKRLQDRHPNASYLLLGALPMYALASSETLNRLQELALRASMRLAGDEEISALVSPTTQSLYEQTLKDMAAAGWKRAALVGLAALALLIGGGLIAWNALGPAHAQTTTTTNSCQHDACSDPQ